MKRIFILFLIVVSACTTETVTEFVDLNVLPVSLIYHNDSVTSQIKRYALANEKFATSYFMRSQKEQSPERAIYLCKRAITLVPSKDKYIALGKLLGENNHLQEQCRLYNFLIQPHSVKSAQGDWTEEYVFGRPDEDLYYENIVNTILLTQSLSGYEVFTAQDAGIDLNSIKERLKTDKRLALDPNSEKYKTIFLQFLDYKEFEAAANNHEMFMRFANSAPDTSAVFSIEEKDIRKFNYFNYNGSTDDLEGYTNSFSSIYAFYLPEKKLAPDTWLKYETKHKLPLVADFTAVIFAFDSSETACPIEMREIYHRLVTYDATGHVIDHMIVAQQAGTILTTANVDHSKITLNLFERKWKRPYDKRLFDNEIVSTLKKGQAKYEIDEEGKIIQLSEDLSL
jgi:hypothetical protein